MNILYLAPLPPPISGHSIASKALLEHLRTHCSVDTVNLSEDSRHDGSVTVKRVLAVLKVLVLVRSAAKRNDHVYLTISESVAGNIKDLLIYAIIGRLIKNTVIHLHGGSFRQQILDRHPLLLHLNRYFLSRAGAVVISGPSHIQIFEDLVSVDRINSIPNFAPDFMFSDLKSVETKFHDGEPEIRVLYVSGMTEGKGYLRLLEAYERLSEKVKELIHIDFAGRFCDAHEEQRFLQRISFRPGVKYHGIISDQQKAGLFADAHVFCLPTSFMEGQPISILEAYASGCVVLTTPRPGILDIFTPSTNGFVISSEDSTLLTETLETLPDKRPELERIAMHNRVMAEEKFREKVFCENLTSILSITNSYL